MPHKLSQKYSGVILNQNQVVGDGTDFVLGTSGAYRQEFFLPSDYRRGTESGELRFPDLSGFQLLVQVTPGYELQASFEYTVQYQVFGLGWITAASGIAIGAPVSGKTWMTAYFEDPIAIDQSKTTARWRINFAGRAATGVDKDIPVAYDGTAAIVYGNRIVASLTPYEPWPFEFGGTPAFLYLNPSDGQTYFSYQQGIEKFWFSSPNPLALPNFVKASLQDTNNTPVIGSSGEASFNFRLLAMVGDDGIDFLGNQYRSVVTRNTADNVSTAAGADPDQFWLSKPNPSKFAVENLYFDVRKPGSLRYGITNMFWNPNMAVDTSIWNRYGNIALDRVNLCPNPSLELDNTGWGGASTGGTVTTQTRQNTWSSSGSWSYRFTGTSGTDTYVDMGSAVAGRIPVAAGETISLRATINLLTLNAANALKPRLVYFDSGGSVILDYQPPTGWITTTGVKTLTMTHTAPASAASVLIRTQVAGPAGNAFDLYVDSVLCVKEPTVPAYFDGDTAGASWTGTPHASTSTMPMVTIERVAGVGPDGSDVAEITRTLLPVTNPVFNPSFETGDTQGWSTYQNGGTGTLTASTTFARSGSYSGKLTATSAITDLGAVSSSAAPITISAGQQLSCAGYSRAETTPRNVQMIIAWYTAADAFISSTSGAQVMNTTNGWTRTPVFTATAPATTARARIYISHNSVANGEVHYVDDINARVNATLLGYGVPDPLPSGVRAGLNVGGIPVVGGNGTWTASFYVKGDPGESGKVYADWNRGLGSEFSSTAFTFTGEWQRVSHTWTIGAGDILSANIYVWSESTSVGESFQMTKAMLERSSTPSDYIDGDEEHGVWTDVAHNSPSAELLLPTTEDIASVIDRMVLDPITPGVYFNIYYSDEGDPGTNEDTWEGKLWSRVPKTFRAERRETHVFPEPVKAKYVKVEFSHLQARHYAPGNFQQPIRYKKHPKWVLDYFLARFSANAQNPFLAERVSVINDAIDLAYNYYLDDLGQEPSTTVDVNTTARTQVTSFLSDRTDVSDRIDPKTLDKINLVMNNFRQHPALRGSADTLLARYARETVDYTVDYSIEYGPPTPVANADVSSLNRDAVVIEQNFPVMFFYLTCRHAYREVEAKLSHDRAYFVGVRELAFLRDNYMTAFDTGTYIEAQGDSQNIEINDFA